MVSSGFENLQSLQRTTSTASTVKASSVNVYALHGVAHRIPSAAVRQFAHNTRNNSFFLIKLSFAMLINHSPSSRHNSDSSSYPFEMPEIHILNNYDKDVRICSCEDLPTTHASRVQRPRREHYQSRRILRGYV
jgi:hypothetical protein